MVKVTVEVNIRQVDCCVRPHCNAIELDVKLTVVLKCVAL